MRHLALLGLLLAACRIEPPAPGPPVVIVEPPPDPPPPPGVDYCIDACDNLARLGCEWAKSTPGDDGVIGTDGRGVCIDLDHCGDDGTCLGVCRVAEEEPETSLRPGCVSWAKSCEEAEACQQ